MYVTDRYIGVKLFERELQNSCPSLIPIIGQFLQRSVTYDITIDSPLVKAQDQITIKGEL